MNTGPVVWARAFSSSTNALESDNTVEELKLMPLPLLILVVAAWQELFIPLCHTLSSPPSVATPSPRHYPAFASPLLVVR